MYQFLKFLCFAGSASKHEDKYEPNVQARQYHGSTKGVTHHYNQMYMTPLEISMYVLLAAFCFAIVVSRKSKIFEQTA